MDSGESSLAPEEYGSGPYLMLRRNIDEVISDPDVMLSMTDIWKTAGAPDGRAPADWSALTTTREFVEVVSATRNAGFPGIIAKKGKNGGTWAHWQIALAYAKYRPRGILCARRQLS